VGPEASARDIRFTRWLFRAYLAPLCLAPFPPGSKRPLFCGRIA
jgi:hypothetical protein